MKVFYGAKLSVDQDGVPGITQHESCYLEWQDSLNLLTQLVQPEIPG